MRSALRSADGQLAGRRFSWRSGPAERMRRRPRNAGFTHALQAGSDKVLPRGRRSHALAHTLNIYAM